MSFKFPFSRFEIADYSMEPEYSPGDRVLAFNFGKSAVGDVIVFALGGKKFIKRISEIKNGRIWVMGDNLERSAKFSPIKHSDIIGKVILKY